MPIPTPDQSYQPGLPRDLSFVDESGQSQDPNRNKLCLAGLIAEESDWHVCDAAWRKACSDEGLTQPFHMSDPRIGRILVLFGKSKRVERVLNRNQQILTAVELI